MPTKRIRIAPSILAAHAMQTQTNYSYGDESDGMIHETYVWQPAKHG
jgi:hypothetical protein